MHWRLLRDHPQSAAVNMAVDEAMLMAVARGDAPPTLRFYAWQPAAVSIGYAQDVAGQVDLAACRELGIEWVRRPTGGRAILHDLEVTYSVVVPGDHPGIPPGVVPSYRVLAGGLAAGLERLGVAVQMAGHPVRRSNRSRVQMEVGAQETGAQVGSMGNAEMEPVVKEGSGAACFDAPSWYELLVDGRKVVGSAQMRRGGAILQHGSILLEVDVHKLFRVLAFPSEEVRVRARGAFARRATSLAAVLGRSPSFHEVCDAVADGFRSTLGVRLVPGVLQSAEEQGVIELTEHKYATQAWNAERRLESFSAPGEKYKK